MERLMEGETVKKALLVVVVPVKHWAIELSRGL